MFGPQQPVETHGAWEDWMVLRCAAEITLNRFQIPDARLC
jgi:hypothetical protein